MNFSNRYLGWAAVPLALAFTGCIETVSSDQVKTSAVYQSYNVTYSERGSLLVSVAQFQVGGAFGTTLELERPSRITYNGDEMKKEKIIGTAYIRHLPNRSFEAEHVWNWTDGDGVTHVNRATILPFKNEQTPLALSKAGSFTFTVSGSEFAPQDRMTVQLSQSNTQGSTTRYMDAQRLSGGSFKATLTSDDSIKLEKGPAELQFKRTRHTQISDGTPEGGDIHASYETLPVEVQIVD